MTGTVSSIAGAEQAFKLKRLEDPARDRDRQHPKVRVLLDDTPDRGAGPRPDGQERVFSGQIDFRSHVRYRSQNSAA